MVSGRSMLQMGGSRLELGRLMALGRWVNGCEATCSNKHAFELKIQHRYCAICL